MKHYLHIQDKIHKYTDNIHYKGCKLKGRKAKKNMYARIVEKIL